MNIHVFKGHVELVAYAYTDIQAGKKVWMFPLRVVGNESIIPKELPKKKKQVTRKKLNLKDKDLFDPVKNTNRLDQSYTTSNTVNRDSYVFEFVNRCARGFCDLCGKPAPIVDKKDKPNIESHHVKWLSKGGEDTI